VRRVTGSEAIQIALQTMELWDRLLKEDREREAKYWSNIEDHGDMDIEQGIWKNNKKQIDYLVTGTRYNATNAVNGQVMVEYQDFQGNKYCRELEEFKQKFTIVKTMFISGAS
jgi:hypothetical protein